MLGAQTATCLNACPICYFMGNKARYLRKANFCCRTRCCRPMCKA